MEEIELQEAFGLPVLIQFSALVGRARAGERKRYLPLNPSGEPTFALPEGERAYRPVGHERHAAEIERVATGENVGDAVFTYFVEGTIMPAAGGRVQVVYESHGKQVAAYVRPESILAVSVVTEGAPASGGLARP